MKNEIQTLIFLLSSITRTKGTHRTDHIEHLYYYHVDNNVYVHVCEICVVVLLLILQRVTIRWLL